MVLANVEALAKYELPEVEITCGQKGGACWWPDGLCMIGEGTYKRCKFEGYVWMACDGPCNVN